MSDTEQLVWAAIGWTIFALFFARLAPSWPGRVAIFGLAVAIPFWELPLGFLQFRKVCAQESGLKVFHKIASQKSVCVDYPNDSAVPAMLKVGFEMVEARDERGAVRQFRTSETGGFEIKEVSKIDSEFCVTRAFVRDLPWRMMRNEVVIFRDSDKKVIARHSDFVWFGMWWQQAASPLLGRGGECRSDPNAGMVEVLKGDVK